MKGWFCFLLILVSTAKADDRPTQQVEMTDEDNLLALLEYVGSWERSDDDWVDPLTLETIPEQADSEQQMNGNTVWGEDHETK